MKMHSPATSRRHVLALSLAPWVPAWASAQEGPYPSRPIRLIVPWPPGGGADTLSRTIVPSLSRALNNQSVIIDNRPGAGGNIGAAVGAKSPADGYHVIFATAATHAINPGLYASMPFKPSEFAPVTRLVVITNVLVVHPDVPANNVQELIALSKRENGLAYSSAGNGSTQHLSAEMFRQATGAHLRHIPYKGGGPAVASTVAGETKVLFADPLAALPFVQSGRLKAIAVTGAQRLASLPNLPTVAESGVPGFEAINWSGIMVPAGTPQPIVNTLTRAFHEALADPQVKEKLTAQGYEPAPSTAPEFEAFVAKETDRWGKLIKAANVKVD